MRKREKITKKNEKSLHFFLFIAIIGSYQTTQTKVNAMQTMTWNEYASVRSDKEAFRLTHYSSLFNSAHCQAKIKDQDFILGWDDRYTSKEWNNQVNQMKKEHLKHFVEIDAQVAEEIKVVLQNYKDELVACQAHLSTGLAGYEYNSAISKKTHLEKMVAIYSRMVDLLPTFEITNNDIITAQNNLAVSEGLLEIEEDFYKKRILTAKCDLLRAILNNLKAIFSANTAKEADKPQAKVKTMQTIVAISNNKCYLFDLYDHEIAKDFVFGETSENGEVHKHGDDGLRYSIYTIELFQDLVNLGVIEFDLLHDYIRFVQIDNE